MSSLTLVRHAQASFFADHYDDLSALGRTQARVLGEIWANSNRQFHEVFVGPAQRHQQTAALVAESYHKNGLSFPQPVMLPELAEYDLGSILRRMAPELARRDQQFANALENQRSGETDDQRQRNFQRMFEPLMIHWQTENGTIDGVESWPMFRERVRRGIDQIITRPGQGRHLAAFTSGGFIGTAVQMVLGAPDRSALEINWRIRNGAVTDFVFSGQRITLDAFNSVAHFTTPELLTYR